MEWQLPVKNMQEFILGCLLLNPSRRPTAHDLLFHRVLFEVHSLKLLAAHCFIAHQYLWPENVEEKTKELDLSKVMAEIRRAGRLPVQWRYSELSFLELDKFLEDVKDGIYPLMNFATVQFPGPGRAPESPNPHTGAFGCRDTEEPRSRDGGSPQEGLLPAPLPAGPRLGASTEGCLCPHQVVQMQCNMDWQEERQQWHLTLLLTLEDKLHRQLSYDLLPSARAGDLAVQLAHYGSISQGDREKLASFLEGALRRPRAPPARGAGSSPEAGGQKGP